MKRKFKAGFFQKIVLPALLTILLFVITIFAYILPAFERNAMNQKRTMLRELTTTAWSILQKYHNETLNGITDSKKAQESAKNDIEALRYGTNSKDYFWIIDTSPKMIMHPYNHELTGNSLQDYQDADGKKLFIEAVEVAKAEGEGFINYKWQFMDDSSRIVPKLSFVKQFEPWGWIIGTGIYLTDIEAELSKLKNSLILILLAIVIIITGIIGFMAYQSLLFENKRLQAENKLRESQERYRALVEASTEGAILVVDNTLYANKTLLSWLGYEENEIKAMQLRQIIVDEDLFKQHPEFPVIKEKTRFPEKYETLFRKKSGETMTVLLNISKIQMAGKDAVVIISKESRSYSNMGINGHFSESLSVNDIFNIGFFKTSFGRNSLFTHADDICVKILGFRSYEELVSTRIENLFADTIERKKFMRQLISSGAVSNFIVTTKTSVGRRRYISVSILLRNGDEDEKYCEGFVQDVTNEFESKVALEESLDTLSARNFAMLLPIGSFIEKAPVCSIETTVATAVQLMRDAKSTCIIIQTLGSKSVGVVTYSDVVERLILEGGDPERPVAEIMTAPLRCIPSSVAMLELFRRLNQNPSDVVLVTDETGNAVNMLSQKQIIGLLSKTAPWIMDKITTAENNSNLFEVQAQVSAMVASMMRTGIHARFITTIISSISDAVIETICKRIVQKLGQPPIAFAVITFGSVGRNEQTLATDQDNAIIYQDTEPEKQVEVVAYLEEFGQLLNLALEQAGYRYCKGDFMARNPKWCQPLSIWKQYFTEWVNSPVPENLLGVEVLFDFRYSWGTIELSQCLYEHMTHILQQNDPFYYHLSANTVANKLPSVVSESFDLKKLMLPIVNYARIYSLKNGINATNTVDRLNALIKRNLINNDESEIIVHLYESLMKIRLLHQIAMLHELKPADNYINASKLDESDQLILKKAVSHIHGLYSKLNFEFKRTIG